VVLHLDGSGEGAVLPLRLMVGDHAFDLELRVTHLELPDAFGLGRPRRPGQRVLPVAVLHP
jgi:hypothetical protein